tara:strand:+ start:1755 stop:2576 length:822 start_codon:yes stop_codon:yes gene_type:complete
MVNYNGTLIASSESIFKAGNRAFLYGDQLFETILFRNNSLRFWEDHYFRMMGGACLLRMEIPIHLNMDFMHQEIINTLASANLSSAEARVRLSLFRTDGGLYTPTDRSIEYLIEVEEIAPTEASEGLVIDVFHDHLKPSQPLYNTKGASSLVSVLSGIFAQENQLDEAIILNTESYICETTASNIFVVKDGIIYTSGIASGCVDGIIRKQLIENASEWGITLMEKEMKTFELIKADEVFLTNSIKGVQWVKSYKKKTYQNTISDSIRRKLLAL